MSNILDILKERGYVQQVTHEEPLRKLLAQEPVIFYIGFDPNAESLHIGHFVSVMAMLHMQRAGHKPIALLGGGTAMVGDPTGKTDMRKMHNVQEIQNYALKFQKQLEHFLNTDSSKAIIVNNSNWLSNLKYIEFLREVGIHFSVNRMLTAECFKTRMERGLSFLEFNYMLMQSYDFVELYRRYNCRLQMGGDDQWSNIISGVDLVRRMEGAEVYGLTVPLLTTEQGAKMGKSEAGAVWLDPDKTSPYDFYQYFRNINDADVAKTLATLTFLPMNEVRRLGSLQGEEINDAKKILAFEVTKLVHGEAEAKKAREASEALFGQGTDTESIPTSVIPQEHAEKGINIADLLVLGGLSPSKSESRRLIQQGGIYLNDKKVDTSDLIIQPSDFKDNTLILRKGKKTYKKIIIE